MTFVLVLWYSGLSQYKTNTNKNKMVLSIDEQFILFCENLLIVFLSVYQYFVSKSELDDICLFEE